jgi:hypothetical protein
VYGPRSSYDSATLARHDEFVREKVFADAMIRALKNERVRKALKEAIEEQSVKQKEAPHD